MRKLGILLLAAWLIITGLKDLADLSFRYDNVVMGALAIAAGVLLVVNR
jgi:hypothetical protein